MPCSVPLRVPGGVSLARLRWDMVLGTPYPAHLKNGGAVCQHHLLRLGSHLAPCLMFSQIADVGISGEVIDVQYLPLPACRGRKQFGLIANTSWSVPGSSIRGAAGSRRPSR